MKIMKTLALVVALLLGSVQSGLAQSTITNTTLSTTITDTSTTRVVVASATGITASTASVQNYILIDHELMKINAISGTTLTVVRGSSGVATPHTSGAIVLFGPGGGGFNTSNGNTYGVFLTGSGTAPAGRCTASSQQYLPVVRYSAQAGNWQFFNCNNSQWVAQGLTDDFAPTLTRYCTPPGVQGLALLTTNGDSTAPFVVGNNTTPTAGSVYYGTIYIPQTKLITGLSILNGTVASTDQVYMGLHRADGVLVANTLLAGTNSSGIGRFQDIDLTATFLATGPARYWISFVSEGTTMRFRSVNLTPGASTAGLGAFIGMLGSSFVNTAPALPNLAASVAGSNPTTGALPTSLIANVAPVSCAY